jgi:uncharacterized membrane protein YphA (DoxX/SURF4 family)
MRKHIRTIVLWVISAFLALVFLNAGGPKFSDASGWAKAFAQWGFPTWFRLLVGAVEVVGGVLLLVPPTAIYAALALAAIMLGAMGTHIFHGDPAAVYHETVPLALLSLVIYLRRRKSSAQTNDLSSGSRKAVALGLMVIFGAAPASGQIPDKFTNLQALPKDITKRALVDTMKSFTRSLGVRCQYCHIGDAGQPLSTFDFVSDTKETKQTARLMLRMVNAINNEHLTKLVKPAARAVQVDCVTCHHGQNRPRALEEVLFEVIAEKGAAAGTEKYHDLRKSYYGGFTFDFRDGVLNNLAQQLQAAGKGDDAIVMLKLNAEVYPEAPMAYFLLGELYLLKGEKTAAIENYKKTLSLAPDNPTAKKKLEELTKQ